MSFRAVFARSSAIYKQNSVQKSICRPIYRMIFLFFVCFTAPKLIVRPRQPYPLRPITSKPPPELIVRKCVSEPSCSDGHLVRIMGRRSVFACFTAFFDADLVRKMGISGFASCKYLAGVASHTAKKRPLSAL